MMTKIRLIPSASNKLRIKILSKKKIIVCSFLMKEISCWLILSGWNSYIRRTSTRWSFYKQPINVILSYSANSWRLSMIHQSSFLKKIKLTFITRTWTQLQLKQSSMKLKYCRKSKLYWCIPPKAEFKQLLEAQDSLAIVNVNEEIEKEDGIVAFDKMLLNYRKWLFLIDKKEFMRAYDFRTNDNVNGFIWRLPNPFQLNMNMTKQLEESAAMGTYT